MTLRQLSHSPQPWIGWVSLLTAALAGLCSLVTQWTLVLSKLDRLDAELRNHVLESRQVTEQTQDLDRRLARLESHYPYRRTP